MTQRSDTCFDAGKAEIENHIVVAESDKPNKRACREKSKLLTERLRSALQHSEIPLDAYQRVCTLVNPSKCLANGEIVTL